MISRWTPERDEQLRKLAADHLTARHIAAVLGPDFTRNAVIGRATRIGVSLGAVRGRNVKPQARTTRSRRTPPRATRRPGMTATACDTLKAASAAPEQPVATVEQEAPTTGPVTLMALRFPVSQCRWIDGQPAGTATVYCGAPVDDGSSYCPEHGERCWASYRRRAA